MGWFSILKTDPNKAMDLADKTLGYVASGLDKLHFSAQEKSVAALKGWDNFLTFIKSQQDENSIRSRTRRVIAIMVIGHFLFFLDLAVFSYWWVGGGDAGIKAGKYFIELAAKLGTLTLAISVFYFGYYAVSNVVGKMKGK
jgi:hypothetical protein